MTPLPDLRALSEPEKDALILAQHSRIEALTVQVEELTARLGELQAKLAEPRKTPDNSSVPPAKGQKANRRASGPRSGPRQGSLGRKGGGRGLSQEPDQFVTAQATSCSHCQAALGADDHVLWARYDKIDLPPIRPVVTRVERYAGRCPRCGGTTLACVPQGLEEGSPFGASITALALYLRFTHAISSQRLSALFRQVFGLAISEGALEGLLRRAKPHFADEVGAILARLRAARVIGSDETTVRVGGQTHWNWVFRNEQVVIPVIRPSRGRAVVDEVLAGHRPAIWVSDLDAGQRGHADEWQLCLAHQLRDVQYAIEAGDEVFAPRLKTVLLKAVILARQRFALKPSTRREYRRRLDASLDKVLRLAPRNRHGERLRRRYPAHRSGLFTFLTSPEAPPDNNGSERDLRPTAEYRKVTGGFRSDWGADLFAAVRSAVGTAARHGIDAYQAILTVLAGRTILAPG
jgi:transposase